MKTFRIMVNQLGGIERVDADYFRVDCGVLYLRNSRGPSGYPECVKAFAAGAWFTVEPEKVVW